MYHTRHPHFLSHATAYFWATSQLKRWFVAFVRNIQQIGMTEKVGLLRFIVLNDSCEEPRQISDSAKTFAAKRNVQQEGFHRQSVFLSNVSAESLIFCVFTKHSPNLNDSEVGLIRFIVLNDSSVDAILLCVSCEASTQTQTDTQTDTDTDTHTRQRSASRQICPMIAQHLDVPKLNGLQTADVPCQFSEC